MGLMDAVGLESFIGPEYGCTGVLTGVGGGHDLDYDRLAAEGVILLGHLRGVLDGTLLFADDLRESLALWDDSWDVLRRMIEAHIEKTGLDARPPDASSDAGSRAWRNRAPIVELDLAVGGISAVIWATGFTNDFGWLEVPVLDTSG